MRARGAPSLDCHRNAVLKTFLQFFIKCLLNGKRRGLGFAFAENLGGNKQTKGKLCN
jgi:hypothetical protein